MTQVILAIFLEILEATSWQGWVQFSYFVIWCNASSWSCLSNFWSLWSISMIQSPLDLYGKPWDIMVKTDQWKILCDHRPSRHEQTTDPVQLLLCLSHKRRLASNADMGFYCVNIMTSFSSPGRIVWTIMSGIITVTRLMSSLGIKDHWVKWIYLWFIHTFYAKRTRWNYIKVDRGIYFKSCVLRWLARAKNLDFF